MQGNAKCEDCYYGNICHNRVLCKYFDPITDEFEDMIIEKNIERDREEYKNAWREYINEYSDQNIIY